MNQYAHTSGPTDADDEMYAPDGFPRALWWDTSTNTLRMVDQTLLPARYRIHACTTASEVGEAIRTLRVRGAPAIGVAAGYGLALEARCAPMPLRMRSHEAHSHDCGRAPSVCARHAPRRSISPGRWAA